MKVYQLIYTSVRHSLSDSELGLVNQAGHRVYSCSQGITKDNIAEIIRFSGYRLPKNNTVAYSEVIGDPTVPGLFPTVFRTLRLSDGRYAAIQSVFSGVDFQGQPGNYFAHAFIFDEVENDFFPEQYCGHSRFKKYLTTKEAEAELIHYLPALDDLKPTEGLEEEVLTFIELHTRELSYIINQAITILTSDSLRNLCICTDSDYLTKNYLLALKWLLPRDVAENTGISTYNVYLPSDKQDRIVFHGTVKDQNNISEEAIRARENCVYIDVDKIDFSKMQMSPILKWDVRELRGEYAKYGFTSVTGFLDWFTSRENVTSPGMGAKLLHLKKSAGEKAFAVRAMELYPRIEDEDMRLVKFEISKVMYDNIELFPEIVKGITNIYMSQCMDKLCAGENYDIDSIFKGSEASKEQAQLLNDKLPLYMSNILQNYNTIGDKNKLVFTKFFAQLKHESGKETWMEFFGKNKRYLMAFVDMAASSVITGSGKRAFTPPDNWTKEDLCEAVAYFESSTQSDDIRNSCVQYIFANTDVDWERYGVAMTRHTKTRGEQEEDMRKIHRMIMKVGYEPFQRNSYQALKHEVMTDVNDNFSPLLLSRLLYEFYKWQGTYGNQAESKERAQRVRELLIEMKKNERSLYNFIIPKLPLEIIESPGHYHELMVNTETMPPSFGNWFIIGYGKIKKDDDKMLTYTRIYLANKKKLLRLPVRKKLREAFKNVE